MQSDQHRGGAPGWYPDPAGVHELRYHNGIAWTGDVSTGGERFVAPLAPQPGTPPRRTGTLALTTGVVGLTIAWMPFVCVIGAALGVVAVVAGVRARSDERSRGSATAGIVTGSLALVFAVGGAWLSLLVLRAVDDYQHPGDYATTIDECVETDEGSRASGSITNLSSSERSYVVEVEFDTGRTADTSVENVAPGATAEFIVEEDLRFTDLECRVSSVTGPAPFGLDLAD